MSDEALRTARSGYIFAAAAFVLWGVLPVYWKTLSHVSPYEILSHRIIWSFIFVMILVIITGRLGEVMEILKNKKKMLAVSTASLFVSVNWLIYIWAVNSGKIVEASLGYYINPLLSFFLGAVVLNESMGKLKIGAMLCAAAGVVYFSLGMGKIPWVSLVLALSFGTYGLIKKMTGVGALESLAVETALITPPALSYIIISALKGKSVFAAGDIDALFLLPLSGVVTAVPLLFFALAANRIRLSSVGFMQFLAPTINLILGTLVYGEIFSIKHTVSFSMIWIGLIMYLSSQLGKVSYQSEER